MPAPVEHDLGDEGDPDVFKYRSKLGTDVAVEALRTWRKKRTSKVETILRYARVCRVERVMRPYLEAMI